MTDVSIMLGTEAVTLYEQHHEAELVELEDRDGGVRISADIDGNNGVDLYLDDEAVDELRRTLE